MVAPKVWEQHPMAVHLAWCVALSQDMVGCHISVRVKHPSWANTHK